MEKWVDGLMARFGQPAVLRNGSTSTPVQVIFQSVNSRSWQNMEYVQSPLGRIHRGQYLCMLPAGIPAVDGSRLVLQGREYEIQKLDNIYFGAKIIYLWGLCVEKGVEINGA